MDKLMLKTYKRELADVDRRVIRIDEVAANKLSEIAIQTGLSLRYIASEMIKFASDRVEVVEK